MHTEDNSKIKNFLFSKKGKEFLVFLFFVCLAGLFWLLQTLNEDYEKELNIGLEFTNVPSNVVITSDIPSEIKVTVKDKGFVLLSYSYGNTPSPVRINFDDYKNKGTSFRISSAEIRRQVIEKLQASTVLISIKPDNYDVVYTRGKAKRLPVRFAGDISAKQQYDVTNIHFNPDTITVYAPQNRLDTMQCVYISPVSYQELTDTLKVETELAHMSNVKTIPNKVNMEICVSQLTQKSLEVPIVPINVPEGKILRTFPAKVTVTFQTVLANYNRIKAEDFLIQVDYSEVQQSADSHCTPKLIGHPRSIKHVGLWPKEIDYLIEDKQ